MIQLRPQSGGAVAEAPPDAPQPVRILFVDHTPIIGGAQLALVHHLRALDRARYQPVVACTDAVPPLVDLYRDAGAEVHIIALPRLRRFDPGVPWRLGRAALALRALVRAHEIDLVVANTSRAAYTAAVALLSTRAPLVWWTRDFLFNRLVFRACRHMAARIICVSEAIRRYYGGDGDPRFAVVRVGSGMHDDLQRLPASAVRAERERWGYRPDDIVIGFMGRLVEEKGPEDLLTAAAIVHERDARIKLLLVGTGQGQESSVEDRLRALVAERGLSFVTFAGFQQAEALYYSVFDVFVLASRAEEAYPTSVVQAMMAGKPVVATDTGGTAELVRDRVTGLLAPPSSPESLAHRIAELLEDAPLRDRLVETARESVLRHNREAVTTALAERCYEAALAARR